MTLQQAPYFCQSAAGSLIPGLTTRNSRGIPHLILKAQAKKPRTAAQEAKAMLLGALSGAWRKNPSARWIHKPASFNIPGPSAYHAYMAENFKRISEDKWPALDFFGPTIFSAPDAGSCSPVIHARSFTCLPNCVTSSIYNWAFFTWSLSTGKVLTQANVTHWFEWSAADSKPITVDRLPAVALYVTYGFADRWGRHGLSFQFGPITPKP
jgi:hypothetical protein